MVGRLTKDTPLHHLTIAAEDGGGLTSQSNAHVYISVLGPQQQPPIFQQARYGFQVREDATARTVIGTVVAKSSDRGEPWAPPEFAVLSSLVRRILEDVGTSTWPSVMPVNAWLCCWGAETALASTQRIRRCFTRSRFLHTCVRVYVMGERRLVFKQHCWFVIISLREHFADAVRCAPSTACSLCR